MTKNKKNLAPCPKCGKKDFYSPAQRGSHMYWKHGVQGKSAATKLSVRKVPHHEKASQEEQRPIADLQFGYVVGRVEQLIQGHADTFGVSARQLAKWVAEALHATAGR